MAVDLNREEVPGIKTYKHLACKLEVPSDVLQEFSGETTAKRSPTKADWTGTSSEDLMRLPTNTNSWIKQLARFLLYFIFSICSK